MTKWMSRAIGKPLLVGENASQAADILKNAKNQPDSSFLLKEKIMENNRPKPRNPRRIPARRPEAEEVSPPRRSASGDG